MNNNKRLWSYLDHFFLEWEIFQTNLVEQIKTHILCSVTFFRKSCHVWDNVEKNVVEPDSPKMTIWRMRIACWITKAKNTHSEYLILIILPCQKWLQEHTLMLRFT